MKLITTQKHFKRSLIKPKRLFHFNSHDSVMTCCGLGTTCFYIDHLCEHNYNNLKKITLMYHNQVLKAALKISKQNHWSSLLNQISMIDS